MNQFKYVFNTAKLSEDAAKLGVQNLLKNSAPDLFDSMGIAKMKELFELPPGIIFNNATQFKGLLQNNNTFKEHALSFVKAI